jgi:hypothetical protein
MAVNQLSQIFGGNLDLIPHIEERAFMYTMRNYAMAQRVTTYTDMTGFNNRKISEYIRTRRAQDLSEDTAIPDHIINRVRESSIAPKEVGDRYRISDRRMMTDLENILSDTIMFLGQAIGDRKEADLIKVANDSFKLGTIGSASTDFTIDLPIQGQFVFQQNAVRDQIYLVVHPFQVMNVVNDLAGYRGTDAGVNMNFREQSLQGFTIPVFQGLNIAVSEFLPRKLVYKVSVYGTGGTFRLEIGTDQEVGTTITGEITAASSGDTTASNIQTALNALTGQTGWTATATDDDPARITVTAPDYVDAESQLRVAIDIDNPTLPARKSAYDQITGLSGAPTDNAGDSLGVTVHEVSGSAKALMFTRDALVYDIRQPVQAFSELEHQGRTMEISAYEKYGVGHWRDERGLFIETKANSPLSVTV